MRRSIRRSLLPALLVLVVSPARQSGAGCLCTADFQDYEVDAFDTFTRGTVVTLTDEILTGATVVLEQPKRLAAPANVSDSDPTAPANPEHLAGFEIRSAPNIEPVRGLVVSNRFGTFTATLLRPVKLYVPASKSLTGPPLPLANSRLDHYLCYDARATGAVKPTLTVVDQFGARTVKLVTVTGICDAVDKNGEGIPTPDEWVTCYGIRVPSGLNHPGDVFVDTQFGQDTYLLTHPDELCVSSTVHR